MFWLLEVVALVDLEMTTQVVAVVALVDSPRPSSV
jgi:hypothetical protein